MSKPTLKEFVLELVRALEVKSRENAAMRTILAGCPDALTKQTWQADLEKIVNDPKLSASFHEEFRNIYASIIVATDDSDLIKLLSKIPRGKAI